MAGIYLLEHQIEAQVKALRDINFIEKFWRMPIQNNISEDTGGFEPEEDEIELPDDEGEEVPLDDLDLNIKQ